MPRSMATTSAALSARPRAASAAAAKAAAIAGDPDAGTSQLWHRRARIAASRLLSGIFDHPDYGDQRRNKSAHLAQDPPFCRVPETSLRQTGMFNRQPADGHQPRHSAMVSLP